MVTINFFFWTFVVLFTIIGAMRGWAKELLVSFSIILALFVMQVGLTHVGPVKKLWGHWSGQTQFYVSSLLIIAFALFGYHTPNNQRINKNLAREKKSLARHWLQDIISGGLLGACNGYLLVGTIWFFLDKVGYSVPCSTITAPQPGTPAGDMALKIIDLLPPVLLEGSVIYIAVAVAFTFIVIVFI